ISPAAPSMSSPPSAARVTSSTPMKLLHAASARVTNIARRRATSKPPGHGEAGCLGADGGRQRQPVVAVRRSGEEPQRRRAGQGGAAGDEGDRGDVAGAAGVAGELDAGAFALELGAAPALDVAPLALRREAEDRAGDDADGAGSSDADGRLAPGGQPA